MKFHACVAVLLGSFSSTLVACSDDSTPSYGSSGTSGSSGSSGTSGSPSATTSGGTTTTTLSSWAIGDWYAPAYDDNNTNKHIPPKGLGITADGKYAHNTSGSGDTQGTWSMSGSRVTVGAHDLDPARNCAFMNYDDGSRVDTYYRSDTPPAGCPDTTPTMTPAERCFLGTFQETTNQNLATTSFKWTRTEFRNEVFDQIYTGNGDTSVTEVQYWAFQNGQVCYEGVEHKPTCLAIDWARLEKTRTTAKDPGCVQP